MTPQDIVTARRHMTDGKLKARVVAKMYGVSERSLWRNRGGPRTSRWYGRAKARRLARARVHVVARGTEVCSRDQLVPFYGRGHVHRSLMQSGQVRTLTVFSSCSRRWSVTCPVPLHSGHTLSRKGGRDSTRPVALQVGQSCNGLIV
jgi:hypothetical protein